MLGKLNRKAMKRALVQTGYKSLHYLPGQKFQIGQVAYFLFIT
jgi:hypothetical protein